MSTEALQEAQPDLLRAAEEKLTQRQTNANFKQGDNIRGREKKTAVASIMNKCRISIKILN